MGSRDKGKRLTEERIRSYMRRKILELKTCADCDHYREEIFITEPHERYCMKKLEEISAEDRPSTCPYFIYGRGTPQYVGNISTFGRKYETYAYVLDTPRLVNFRRKKKQIAVPVVQLIGTMYFTLLEAAIKCDVPLFPFKRVYIGRDERQRSEIAYIKGRVSYRELTEESRRNLIYAIERIAIYREESFIKFFNTAGPIKLWAGCMIHQLDLLPKLWKRTRDRILEERRKCFFKNYEDLQQRAKLCIPPERMIALRILAELTGSKYKLFVRL